jgi:hypothetical protein
MKKIVLRTIYFVLLSYQTLIFSMKPEQITFDQHRKNSDEYTQNIGKNLKAAFAVEFKKQQALQKLQEKDRKLSAEWKNYQEDNDRCTCIIS